MERSVTINNCELKVRDETYIIKELLIKKRGELMVYNKKVEEIKSSIYDLEKRLFNTCKHTFVRDHSAASDDIFKYQCSHCGSYNLH